MQEICITVAAGAVQSIRCEGTGDTVLPLKDIERLVQGKNGQVFSRAVLEYASDAITLTMGNFDSRVLLQAEAGY